MSNVNWIEIPNSQVMIAKEIDAISGGNTVEAYVRRHQSYSQDVVVKVTPWSETGVRFVYVQAFEPKRQRKVHQLWRQTRAKSVTADLPPALAASLGARGQLERLSYDAGYLDLQSKAVALPEGII